MNSLRRTPLWVSVGLLWWAVLFSYGPSRPLLLYQVSVFSAGAEDLGHLALAGWFLFGTLSLAHALGAAWLVTRILPWFHAGRNAGSFAWWTLLVAWFAVASGCFVSQLIWCLSFATVSGPLDVLAMLFMATFASILTLPAAAFIAYGTATWVVVPLAAASVFIVRRWGARVPSTDGFGRPLGTAGC